ncbi:MAG: hypothetical protein WD208_11435 [Dehalococcoidia bacterium]
MTIRSNLLTQRDEGESRANGEEVRSKQAFVEPKLTFVEPKLMQRGDLNDVTKGFFGSFSP